MKYLFFIFSTLLSFGQGTTCGTATTLPIDGSSCGSGTISNTVNTAICGSTNWRRVWYYSFTVTGGPLDITVSAQSADRNLVLALFSGTCAGLSNLACVDNNTTAGAQTETLTHTLNNGTYYIAVGNTTNNNITLNNFYDELIELIELEKLDRIKLLIIENFKMISVMISHVY